MFGYISWWIIDHSITIKCSNYRTTTNTTTRAFSQHAKLYRSLSISGHKNNQGMATEATINLKKDIKTLHYNVSE